MSLLRAPPRKNTCCRLERANIFCAPHSKKKCCIQFVRAPRVPAEGGLEQSGGCVLVRVGVGVGEGVCGRGAVQPGSARRRAPAQQNHPPSYHSASRKRKRSFNRACWSELKDRSDQQNKHNRSVTTALKHSFAGPHDGA